MNEYIEILNTPLYISVIVTILVFIVNLIDNKIQKQEQSYTDQLRKSIYSGVITNAILFLFQSITENPEKIITGPM